MDRLWFRIMDGVAWIMGVLDALLAPLNAVHPALGVTACAVAVFLLAKLLSRFKTPRYKRLKAEFEHWFEVRQQALTAGDPEKARQLAKNIDDAGLNRIYYDFFLEGFLLNVFAVYLPVLCMAGYVNEAYRPARLREMAGADALFRVGGVAVTPLLWYVAALLLLWLATKAVRIARRGRGAASLAAPPLVETDVRAAAEKEGG
jgi:uncharacterized membrane protein YhdT